MWCFQEIRAAILPSWMRVRHEAATDAVLFSFSDPPMQEALFLYREDRGGV
jgi:gentisate 1,2-dioxygenase